MDLIIVASQPIDAPETLKSIYHKVQTYLKMIDFEEFQAEVDYPPREKIDIFLSCEFPIHPAAQAVIDECRASAQAQRVRLGMGKSPR